MKMKATTTLPFRRRVEQKTDYDKRIKLIRSNLPRLVVRKSNKNILAQIITYSKEGDKTVISANSRELIKLGWTMSRKNSQAAYLLGLMIAKKAKTKGVKEAVLDLGLATPIKQNVQYCVLKGALDNGLAINHGKEILPTEDRIKGKHITKYLTEAKEGVFQNYKKLNLNPEKIEKLFDETKAKILK